MKLSVSLLAFLVLFTTNLPAQAEVSSKAYGFMLNNLLAHSVSEISAVEAQKLVDEVIFLDAREAHEYEVSHIKDAIFVGYDDFQMQRVLDNVPKSKKVVVYCSVGYRSEKVSEQLLEAGYQDVSNLYGGIFEWKNLDYPVYNAQDKTNKVHAFDRIWGVWLNNGIKVYKKP